MRKSLLLPIVMIAASVLLGPPALASPLVPEDGVVAAQRLEGKHFVIEIAEGVDQFLLLERLDIGPGHKILADVDVRAVDDLASVMDAFFVWTCGVLDMRLYSYKGKLKVVKDAAALADIYRALYGVESPDGDKKAFYIYENNTLYVSLADFTREIVGHEIAHAVISNYFVVQPPVKVAEVLAGYIEYQLRKPSL